MTDLDILNLFSDCPLDYKEGFDESDFNKLIFSHLPPDFRFHFENGCTRLVIIPYDYDFVIKIPFCGDPHILKEVTSYNDGIWNFCELELGNYLEAKSRGYEDYFLPIRFIGLTASGYPIYVQEKGLPLSENWSLSSSSVSEDFIMDYESASGREAFCESWQASLYEYVGQETYDDVIDFIEFLAINDLHSGNVGYSLSGCPVLIDYAGY